MLVEQIETNNNLFEYEGRVNHEVCTNLLKKLKNVFTSKFESKALAKQIYQAVCETVENVINYEGIQKNKKINLSIVGQTDDCIKYTVENFLKNEDVLVLNSKLKEILSFNNEELKDKIKEILKTPNNNSKGAGIGLMLLVSKSNVKTNYYFQEVNDTTTLFSISFSFKTKIVNPNIY